MLSATALLPWDTQPSQHTPLLLEMESVPQAIAHGLTQMSFYPLTTTFLHLCLTDHGRRQVPAFFTLGTLSCPQIGSDFTNTDPRS